MRLAFHRKPGTNRSLEPVAWGALPVLALGVGVIASGVGIDLLVVAVGCLFLLALDRTVGDWLAETLGSGLGTVAFALAVIALTWYFISYPSDAFFAAAEERGYRTRLLSANAIARHSRRKWQQRQEEHPLNRRPHLRPEIAARRTHPPF